jgi:cytochrome c553
MKRNVQRTVGLTVGMAALSWVVAFAVTPAMAPAVDVSNKTNAAARVERGAYLVRTMGCNDCHTPWKMGPRGPEPDMSRALTGHPAEMVLPPPPPLPPGPWTWLGAATNTAFAGPWGVSFTANLTPDVDTGLGNWTEEMFIATMKTGRHEGKGRPLLPPMPYPVVASLNDEDIRSLFAYLRSLKPVRNRVPAPVDPPEGQ